LGLPSNGTNAVHVRVTTNRLVTSSSIDSIDLVKIGHVGRPRMTLVCLPCAGAGVQEFQRWAGRLPPWLQLAAVRLPGRETRIREPPFARLGPLVESVGQRLASELCGDVALFGHSMGALIAFELARWLRAHAGRTPHALLVAARPAPHVDLRPSRLHELPDEDLLRTIDGYNGSPRAVLGNSKVMQRLLPTLRADFAVVETYRYRHEPRLQCPVTAFAGHHDTHASIASIARWADQTIGPFTLHTLPGDHFFTRTHAAPLGALIGETLAAGLARVQPYPTEEKP
jgi:medium-chain acyl-[acyl-carrier-protein] hydrolase